MSSIDQHIRALAPQGIRITLWATERGFQANVSESGSGSWTCETRDDPVEALSVALRLRATGAPGRTVVHEPAMQIDMEDAIAATVDDLEGMLG